MGILKVFTAIITFFVCWILCSSIFIFFFKSIDKSIDFGNEYIGLEYSVIIHKFGRQPDLVEHFTLIKPDKEFESIYGTFVDSCNQNNKLIKFTYKNIINDITMWGTDNGKFTEVILVR